MKQAKDIKLYNVYYDYDNSMTYETTTDNFDKWLEQHNEERAEELACGMSFGEEEHKNKECTCYEREDEFVVKDASLILFDEVEDEQAKDN
tara:strand:+ start:395 stop:667 length:273 start_codon:yes stop_codon:yes gene_type:complete